MSKSSESLLDSKIDGLELIVFDLDYTLWPFHVDTNVDPPFRKENEEIRDRFGTRIKCFPQVPSILKKLHSLGYKLAVASRTETPREGRQLVDLFGWDKFFSYYEIYPGCKVTHFNSFKKTTGFSFDQMIFFDDENRNIRDISKLGVVSIFITNGVNEKVIEEGFKEFIKSRTK